MRAMPTIGEVKIGHERVFAVLSDVHDGSSTRSTKGELWSMHVRVELPYLRAEAQVWRSDPAIETPLAPFFDELGSLWKGWEGVREWRNYEGNFGLSCTNDGLGHVTVTVELQVWSPYRWLVRGDVLLDAGQLEQVARELHRFEQPPGNK
jgi:hypothetical protein